MVLARNAVFNLLGASAPAVVSLLTLPYIVKQLGATDFGVLSLVMAIVGYFALLDINVTAGSTKFVAEFRTRGQQAELHGTVVFGFSFYAGIGLAGMAGLFFFAQPLVTHVFDVPAARVPTAVAAVRIASLGFLLGQVLAYLQSLPGALMRYDVSGGIEASFGALLPVLTVLLLLLGLGLLDVIWLRVAMSAVQIVALLRALRRLLPGFRLRWPRAELRRALLGFSAFAFLSRVAAISYAQADKLIIGARLGVPVLTYYVVPSTLANRVMALVFRLSGVMFPHASALAAAQRIDELRADYLIASRYMFFLNGALALSLALLAEPVLTHWLSADFARLGTAVMVMVALGQWADSLTNLPSLVNDGLGHPRITGSFALARAAVGLVLIFFGIDLYGIRGAAGGHLVASLLMSALFLAYVHGRSVPVRLARVLREAYGPALLALLPGALLAWLSGPAAAQGGLELAGAALLCACVHAAMGLFFVLKAPHRLALVAGLRGRLVRR